MEVNSEKGKNEAGSLSKESERLQNGPFVAIVSEVNCSLEETAQEKD